MTNKEIYRSYCQKKDSVLIFHQPWWLDAVCGEDQWDVSICLDKEGHLQGGLPYFFQKKYGFVLMRQALLTPYMGPIIEYPRAQKKLAYKYAHEKKVIDLLIEGLPAYSYFNQHCDPSFTNGQPFYWNGMQQETYYTYVIQLDKQYQDIEKEFEGRVRTDIRKADTGLRFSETEDIDMFYQLNKKSFDHQKIEIPYSIDVLKRLDQALTSRQKRHIHIVEDEQGVPHAGAYVIKDQDAIYTLMIGSDPDLRKNGAVAMLISKIILTYKSKVDRLDFCGSMIEKFQRIFRSFGAEQVPYLRISHKRSQVFKLVNALTGKGG